MVLSHPSWVLPPPPQGSGRRRNWGSRLDEWMVGRRPIDLDLPWSVIGSGWICCSLFSSGNKQIRRKNIPNSNNYKNKSTNVCWNDVWELFEINRDNKNFACTPVLGHLACKSVPGGFANLAWEPVPGNLFLEACPWKPIPANLVWKPVLGTFSWKPCLGILLANLFLATLLGHLFLEPVLGNLAWKPFLGNPCLETLLGNLLLRTLLGNLFLETFRNLWEPNPGNLAWKPCLGTSSWEPLPGNLWEPCLATCFWKPLGIFGNLFLGTLPGNELACCRRLVVGWDERPRDVTQSTEMDRNGSQSRQNSLTIY